MGVTGGAWSRWWHSRRGWICAASVATLLLVTVVGVSTFERRPWQAAVPRLVSPDVRFYADTRSSDATWVRSNPQDQRAGMIHRHVATRPQGIWLTSGDPDTVTTEVQDVVSRAARRGRVPVLVLYAIPGRDCYGPSAGGAADVSEYQRWVSAVSRGLGGNAAWIVLEPDALAQLGCLSPAEQEIRYRALSRAARTLRTHAPAARIYFDAGNSSWLPASTIADRLVRASVRRYGDGIALNVSNFQATDAEVAYGIDILRSLDDSRMRMVIDTGRNGAGGHGGHGPCDPPGWTVGEAPAAGTYNGWVDALLWIKPPAQSDGCRAAAGTFLPDVAYRLAVRMSRGPD